MNKYTSAYDKIKVTIEMEKRIKATLEKESNVFVDSPKKSAFHKPAKQLVYALSACCLLVLIITFSYSLFFNSNTDPNIEVTDPFQGFTSLDELKDSLTFDLKTPTGIPAEYKIDGISLLFGKTAQVRYSNDKDTIIYRVAPGKEDISGDYNEYNFIQTKNISGIDVTLKGKDDKIFLAVWTDDDFSYSINISEGMLETLMIEIVFSIIK